jgi:hypothetical protein
MQTTELFVEQIIIGLLVILTGWYLYGNQELPDLKLDTGVGLLISAYLAGILYDRVTDTLFENFDRLLRLDLGRKEWKADKSQDCFPEQTYLVTILSSSGSVSNYSLYLRSRYRLTRAMATILPAVTTAYLLSHTHPGTLIFPFSILVSALYLMAFLSKMILPDKWMTPKTTSSIHLLEDHFDKHYRNYKYHTIILRDIIKEPVFWLFIVLLIFDIILISGSWFYDEVLIAFGGNIVSLIAFWAWLRINTTYKKMVRDFYINMKEKSVNASAFSEY